MTSTGGQASCRPATKVLNFGVVETRPIPQKSRRSRPCLRRSLLDDLAALNELKFQQVGDPEIRTRIAQHEMAYRMQTSVPELTDFSDEPIMSDLYGPQVGEPGTLVYNC